MRKILTLAAVVALAGCGGGGGGSAPAPSSQQPTTPVSPQSNYVKPTFLISIPARGKSNSKARQPKFVSPSTTTVTVSLTADSAGVAVGSITGNPVSTTVTPPCSPCTVAGPPSPPGTDSFLVVTTDSAGTPNTLNAGQLNSVTITAGQANSESLTLGGIPASLAITGVPTTWDAGTQSQTASISVIAYDADSNQISSGTTPYVNASGNPVTITVSDPDTNAHGTCLVASGTSTCTGAAATSQTLTTANGTIVFDYDGLAEDPVTLTASASGATNGTQPFQPTLNAPAFNSSQATPAGVALTGSAEIDLFNTSGIGSTGSESFTETGWTNSPYAHTLTQTAGSCLTGAGYVATTLAGIATMSVGTNDTTNGTPITATVAASPSAGSCADTVSDGLSLNSTDGSATLTVTYTTTGIGASSKHRRN